MIVYYDDPRFRPFWSAVDELGVPFYLHPRDPLPDRVTDRDIYERTATYRVVPDCNDLHCFRALVAWTLGVVPGPSTLKWRSARLAIWGRWVIVST